MKNNHSIFSVFVILGFVFFPFSVKADQTTKPEPRNIPALGQLVKENTKIIFDGKVHGLNSWIIFRQNSPDPQIIFTTEDNQGLIAGYLFGPEGEDITYRRLQNYKEKNKPEQTQAKEFLKAVEESHWIKFGNEKSNKII